MAAQDHGPGHGRVDRVAAALLVALALSLLVAVSSGSGSSTARGGRLGGDFPEFYGAGSIVRDGDAEELYEPERQAASQRGLFGDEDAEYLDFAYPPVVALAYAPLSALPYRLAYLVHVSLMVGALTLALRLVRPMVPFVGEHFMVTLTGALVFFPMFRAVSGGQNTALTLLLLAAAWRARHDDRDVLAGVLLGALLYKPQLAILLLLAHVVTRRWRVVAGSAIAAAGIWVISALVMGPGWFGPFLDHARAVPDVDGVVGGGGSVSLLGTAQRFDGTVETVLVVLAVLASVAVALACLAAWRSCDSPAAGADLGRGVAILTAGTVVAAPHVIFYDAGLLVLVGLVALSGPDRLHPRVIGIAVALGLLGAFDEQLPVNPLLGLAAACLAWALGATPSAPKSRPDRTVSPGGAPAQGGHSSASSARHSRSK